MNGFIDKHIRKNGVDLEAEDLAEETRSVE
jgi:hypothetical protein